MTKKTKELNTAGKSAVAYRYILEPWVTEKSHAAITANKYVFKVTKDARKENVKKAVEELYGVTVEKLNVVNIPSKKRVFGRTVGRKSAVKKAIVTLKEGDKIEFFKGV